MAYENSQLKNDHYVYVLKDVYGIIRYVGEGRRHRWKQKSGRTTKYLDILKNGGEVSIICCEMTKKQSTELESKIIFENKETVINKIKSSKVKKIIFDEFDSIFYIDGTSPSGLSRKQEARCRENPHTGSITKRGYYHVSHMGITYKVHRIVWVLHNKKDLPEYLVVHHVDGNPSNNSPSNLEAVSQRENSNRKVNLKNDNPGISILSKRGLPESRLVITFCANDDRYSKEFSLNKYSKDKAIELATLWKNQVLESLNV